MSAAPKIKFNTEMDALSSAAESFGDLVKDVEGFLKLSAYLKIVAGINLPQTGKNLSLMAGRVGPLMRRNSLGDYGQLYARLKNSTDPIGREFVTLMTTNTTHWFREAEHFNYLSSVLPKYFQAAISEKRTLKLWCAAASSGQEPYTLALVVLQAWEKFSKNKNSLPPFKILGTDINEKVLKKAATGIYKGADMRGLPEDILKSYFNVYEKEGERFYQVGEKVAGLVQFAPLNLMDESFPFRGSFDFIFCRNVFIYFERDLCAQIVEKMAAHQAPQALLFLGHSEVGTMRSKNYRSVAHAIFERLSV